MNAHSSLFNVETVTVGGLPMARLDLRQTARLMVDAAYTKPRGARPLFFTSANGEVIARCLTNRAFSQLMHEADLISADGQPLVFASRLFSHRALPERVATTDLFELVAAEAEKNNASFYLFGASEEVNRKVYERARWMFPKLNVLGRSHGYLRGDDLERKIAEIDALGPEILWIAMGAPLEQHFVKTWSGKLTNVGLIKTAGGLFDFLSGAKPRAPKWMQRVGLEWAYRLLVEPRRLFLRYAVTNPIALLQLILATH